MVQVDRVRVHSNSRSESSYTSGSRHSKKRKITDDEIAEYVAKKAQKTATKAAKQLRSISVYANESNPFGDSNLNEKFVWRKKIERDVSRGVSLDELSIKAQRRKQKERMAEHQKLKKRREVNAIEKAQREEEMDLLARERDRAEFQDWEKKEEEFQFEQSRSRSEIRLSKNRAKPIDILAINLDPLNDFGIKMGITEPCAVFKGLSVEALEELYDEIKMHISLDRSTPIRVRYWECLLVVCESEIAKTRKNDTGLHSSIEADVKKILQEQTYSELEVFQSQIKSQMQSGTALNVEYWESVLRNLDIYKAKAFLKDFHSEMVHKQSKNLSKKPSVVESSKSSQDNLDHDIEKEADKDLSANPAIIEEPEEGSYSPQLFHGGENEDGVVEPEEDKAILEKNRLAVLEKFERTAMKAMGTMEDGDAVFGSKDEISLDSDQVYWLDDKYRPRKPKYFNRVHTGYEWNKYNQTHYDHDNPPPKTVHGYKFNIFYPDLVEKGKAPTYTIERDGDSIDTCVIKFHAGPPYEDIAFRIVNKDWECSRKKGFKCTFERGILHVYFNLKRYRYRR